jgi:hypothetical protein
VKKRKPGGHKGATPGSVTAPLLVLSVANVSFSIKGSGLFLIVIINSIVRNPASNK